MAQLNIRISDTDKAVADKVTQSLGLTLGEYLGSIVKYIADNRTLPVQIKLKPVAIKPEEAFQQAITLYRNAFLQIQHLHEKLLVSGEMTPLEALRNTIADIEAAQAFYNSQVNLIALAPSQLERVSIDENDSTMFAQCREHFPIISRLLLKAIRAVNMKNRPIADSDLEEMENALKNAAAEINILQNMTDGQISTNARIAFFLREIKDASECAYLSSRPNEPYIVCVAWKNRMNNHIRQAEIAFQNLGIAPKMDELAASLKLLKALGNSVHSYLDLNSEPMPGLASDKFDDLNSILTRLHKPDLN